MIIYSLCTVCGKEFTECLELRAGECVVFNGEEIICEECRRDDLKCLDDCVDESFDNDEWLNYYSNDYMDY